MYEETIKKLVDKANEIFEFNVARVAKLGRLITDNISQTNKNKSEIELNQKIISERKQYDLYVSKSGDIKSIEEVQEYIYRQRQLGNLKRVVRVFVVDLEIENKQTELNQGNITYYLADTFRVLLEDNVMHAFVVKSENIKLDGGIVKYKHQGNDESKNISVYSEGDRCVVKNMKIINARYPRPFVGVDFETNIETI